MAQYILERRIGDGGMAEVFRGRRVRSDGSSELCAVKRLLPELAQDAHLRLRFHDEARISQRLDHPAIVRIFDFYEEAGRQHLAMELVDGASVEGLLLNAISGRFIPVAVSTRIAMELASALEHAHSQGVLHRDVSASNVLISKEGAVKLADFGIADALGRLSATEPGGIAGKAAYMSPQRRRGAAATEGDDLYALGVLLGRLLDAADPRERGSESGEPLRELHRQLNRELPEDRVSSAAVLANRLRVMNPAPPAAIAALVQDDDPPPAAQAKTFSPPLNLDAATDRGVPPSLVTSAPPMVTRPSRARWLVWCVGAVFVALLGAGLFLSLRS